MLKEINGKYIENSRGSNATGKKIMWYNVWFDKHPHCWNSSHFWEFRKWIKICGFSSWIKEEQERNLLQAHELLDE